jgi:hypothetical protein
MDRLTLQYQLESIAEEISRLPKSSRAFWVGYLASQVAARSRNPYPLPDNDDFLLRVVNELGYRCVTEIPE